MASTLGLLWLSNIDPDGVAHRLGHSAECINHSPFTRRSFDPRFFLRFTTKANKFES